MKTPTAVKLPSGAWRCRVTIDGKMISITKGTKIEAEMAAIAFKSGAIDAPATVENITLGNAVQRYIDARSAVLSPSTIYNYRKLAKTYFLTLQKKPLKKLSKEALQKAVNELYQSGKSPKTVRNIWGFFGSAIKEYRPDLDTKINLPQKEKKEITVPTSAEISAILKVADGTPSALPIRLAAFMGLRLSEVCGLDWSDIKGGKIHIRQAKVYAGGGFKTKAPKSVSGDRWLNIPTAVADFLPQKQDKGPIITIAPSSVQKRWYSVQSKVGGRQFRFHDLRHFYASSLLLAGVPMSYIVKRMGHSSEDMVKRVYGHVFPDADAAFDAKIEEQFNQLAQKN